MYFGINKGDKVGIIGWNGAGKSILLKVVFQRLTLKKRKNDRCRKI
jgi:ABC-type polysaccharide/polyol phosphate transport system ATPase subunit